ncbi:MAG: PleD family two-component response regulator, partial [Gammaproteobacteria bacterium]
MIGTKDGNNAHGEIRNCPNRSYLWFLFEYGTSRRPPEGLPVSVDKPKHTGTAASADVPSVAIIDCDAKMRNDLVHLLESQNISPIPFSSSAEFLGATLHGTMVEPNIKLVLCRFELEQDRGLELLQRLRDENFKTPCLVYSSHGDVSTAVNSLRTGALDFIDNARPDMCFCERVLRLLP